MSYQRNIYEKGFAKAKAEIAAATGNYHTDTYTGLPLKPGEPWDFEHIISAKEFSSLSGVSALDPAVQSAILNCKENIGTTMRTINKSKSKYALDEWLHRTSNGRQITNAAFYGIDIIKATQLRFRVLELLEQKIRTA